MGRYNTSILEQRRLQLGHTYTRVAQMAGIGIDAARRTLIGQRAAPGTVARLAAVLGVDMADLVVAGRAPTEGADGDGRRRPANLEKGNGDS